MANIEFTPSAQKRYNECCQIEENTIAKPEYQLQNVIARLSSWRSKKIIISNDICDDKSFFFRCIEEDGRPSICGGIILHGKRDGFGTGQGPTYSVSLIKETGWQIHT